MTGDTEYQLVTLKRALGRNGVVCRLRTDNGTVRVDVFWSPPRMQRNLRPFTSMQPVALLQDFACNGFARVGDGALEDLAKAGILVASFASEAMEGAGLARSIISRHGLGRSDLRGRMEITPCCAAFARPIIVADPKRAAARRRRRLVSPDGIEPSTY